MEIEGRSATSLLYGYRFADFLLLLYLCALFGNRTGIGFDYYFLRISFVAYVLVFFLAEIIPIETGRKLNPAKDKLFNPLVYWVATFLTYTYFSAFWSISFDATMSGNYISAFVQVLFLVIFINYRIQSRGDLFDLLRLLVIASLYSAVLLIIKTPTDLWGYERLAPVLGINPNRFGLNMAFAVLISIFLARNTKSKIYYVFAAIFVILALLSGSKKALFLVIAGIVLIMSFSYKGFKGLAVSSLSIAIVSAIVVAVMVVPGFYDLLGYRVEEFFLYAGNDGSTAERAWFREYAKGMFLSSPIVGHGFNSFFAEMRNIGYVHQAYCHCNQWELLADLGLIGFCLYYSIFVRIGKGLMRFNKSNSSDAMFGIIFLILIFITDYGYVSFVSPEIYIYIALIYCLSKIVLMEVSKDEKSV